MQLALQHKNSNTLGPEQFQNTTSDILASIPPTPAEFNSQLTFHTGWLNYGFSGVGTMQRIKPLEKLAL